MNIDLMKIKSAFTQEVSKKLELGQEVEINLKGSIVKTEAHDNQDGSVNLVFVFKPEIIDINNERINN